MSALMDKRKVTFFDFEGESEELIRFKKSLDDEGIKSKIENGILTVKCFNHPDYQEEKKMFEIKNGFNVGWID